MSKPAQTDSRRRTGAVAEQAAADHLEQAGWRILARNVRWREGELDIVGIADGALVFVEVKALVSRGGRTPFSPFESIGRRKQQRVRMLARRWIADSLPTMRGDDDLGFSSIRFDAIAVTVGGDGQPENIEHVADAF
ncbi:MAG: YraN family protein [Actinobacteria bacterium]|nr:YraN family protein [Actinomycetota bacterium]